MAAPPYMPLYVADYLGDTRHLTTEQHGAYLLLLMALWRAGGRLPADEAKLARLTGMSRARWAKAAEEVGAFFTLEDGELTHPRLVEELARYERSCDQRRAAGARGGAANARRARLQKEAGAPPPLPPRSSEPAAGTQAAPKQPEPKPKPEDSTDTVSKAGAWSRDQLDALERDLREAAGAALNAAAPALLNLAPILGLLNPGQGPPADLEADVLPAIRASAAKQRPSRVSGWAYYAPAILEWRDRRLAGAPEAGPVSTFPEIPDDDPSRARRGRASRAEKRAVWAEVLADEAGA